MTIKILNTKNYDLFQTNLLGKKEDSRKGIKGNRGVKKGHVNKLKLAIAADPEVTEYNPILVNEKMEVIDGQHRLAAIKLLKAEKKLDIPIHYIKVEGLDLKNVQALNSNTKSWTPMDYAEAYFITGKKSYGVYLDHKKEFGFNHDVTLNYAGFPHPNSAESFKHGAFKSGDREIVWQYSNNLRAIKAFLEHAYVRPTALALLEMFQHPKYDHQRMCKMMKKHGLTVERYTRKEESLIPLARAYNKGLSKKNYINFIKV